MKKNTNKDEVIALLTKYQNFMPLLENGGKLLNLAELKKYEYENLVVKYQDVNDKLISLENKNFSLLEKYLTKYWEYKRTCEEIGETKIAIHLIDTLEIPKSEENFVLIDLLDRFRLISLEDQEKCIDYFCKQRLPTNIEDVNHYFKNQVMNNNGCVPERYTSLKHQNDSRDSLAEESTKNDEEEDFEL